MHSEIPERLESPQVDDALDVAPFLFVALAFLKPFSSDLYRKAPRLNWKNSNENSLLVLVRSSSTS